MKDKQSKDTRQSKDSGWFRYLISPMIVGVIVFIGQAALQPWVAEGIKTKESILEQRYKACENAVSILQRRLATVKMTGGKIPEWHVASEKNPPTQAEVNTAYNLLLIYCKSDTIAEQFYKASIGKDGKIRPLDIPQFISAVRKELKIDKKGLTNPSYHYIFIKPQQSKDEQNQ